MHEKQSFAEWLLDHGFSVAFFIAGVFGSIASLLKSREMTFFERVVTILSGGGTAAYITPLVVDLANLSTGSSYGVGFIIGYVGLKSVEWVIEAIRSRIKNEEA